MSKSHLVKLAGRSPSYIQKSVDRACGELTTLHGDFFFFFFFFCVPQLYLWGSPLLGEIFAYVTVF